MTPQSNPWRRRSRRVAYDNAWITVYEDQVTRPDGQPGVVNLDLTRATVYLPRISIHYSGEW